MTNLKATVVLTVMTTLGSTAAFAQSADIAYTAPPAPASCTFTGATNGSNGGYNRVSSYFSQPTVPATVTMDITNMGSVGVSLDSIVGSLDGVVTAAHTSTDWWGSGLALDGATPLGTFEDTTGFVPILGTSYTDSGVFTIKPGSVKMDPLLFQASNGGDYTVSFLVTCLE